MTKLNVCDLEVGDLARVVRPGQDDVRVQVIHVTENRVCTRVVGGSSTRTWYRADGLPCPVYLYRGQKLRTLEAP